MPVASTDNTRHLDPAIQTQVALAYHDGLGTLRELADRFQLRNPAAATHAAYYGRELLGLPHPTRRRNGQTQTQTATGWMVVTGRKWGVEVEVSGLSVSGSAAALRRVGVDVEERHSWMQHGAARGHDRPTVKVEPDGTAGVSAEAVLPPVAGDEGLALLKTVMSGLKQGGARVSGACGMHVHVDANDLTVDQMLALVDQWVTIQSSVYRFVPAGRRRSQWCPPLSGWDVQNLRERLSNGSLRPGGRTGVDRYRGLNLDAYRAYGTVEFRIHGGSLNPTKAKHWVALVVGIVEAAKTGVTLDGTSPDPLVRSMADAGLLPAGSAQWLTNRAAAMR